MRRKNPGKYKRIQKESATTELDSFFAKLKKEGSTEPSGSFMDMGNADTQEGVIADMGNADTQDNVERAEEVIS